MITLTYIDEDGQQSLNFSTESECDDFIRHNEERVKYFLDEKFEVVSISNSESNERS